MNDWYIQTLEKIYQDQEEHHYIEIEECQLSEETNESMEPMNEAYLQLRMMYNDLINAGFSPYEACVIVAQVAMGKK